MIPHIEYRETTINSDDYKDHPNFEEATQLFEDAKNTTKYDVKKALEMFMRVDHMVPNVPVVLHSIHGCYANLNDRSKAKEYIQKILEIQPNDIMAISFVPEYWDMDEQDCEKFVMAINEFLSHPLPMREVAMLEYSLAEMHEKQGDIENEVRHLQKHNNMMFEMNIHGGYNFYNYIHTRNGLVGLAPVENKDLNDYTKPLFVVGMPRSGSTLLDQILASHSKIESIGESFNIDRLLEQVEKDLQSGSVEKEQAYKMNADDYMSALNTTYPDAIYIVDKMLSNYWKINAIKKVFPKAKFIQCRRNPMAVGLSCWKERLGTNKSWQFCNSLEEIGKYYTHVYEPVIEHWKQIYPDDIFVLDYEDLITNFDETVAKLLEFLDIEFEEGMREFHKLDRHVNTISRWQVRQPLYNKLDNWKKYEPYLDDLRRGLESTQIIRECGECHVCCVETEIDEGTFKKGCNETCKFLDISQKTKKCSVYDDRPNQCKSYFCSWIGGFGTEFDRPDKTGVIANLFEDDNKNMWISVRELRKSAVTKSGKHFVIDLVIKNNVPAIVKPFGSDNPYGDWVVIKEGLLHRSDQIRGKFIGWLNDAENIGIYELKIS